MSRFIRRSARTVYENPWLRFEAHDIVHPNGQRGEHGVVVTPAASAVVVIDGKDVLLTRQARFAIDRVTLEIVKGGRAADEDALACAQRELREELGVAAKRWDSLGEAFEIPSIVALPVALFLARDIRGVERELERVESIDLVRMPFEVALHAVATGVIDDAVTALAFMRAEHMLRT